MDESLMIRQAELERLGFRVLQVEPETLIAGRRSFYWDCIFTFVNYTVFVRRVATLSVQIIESDRPDLLSRSKRLNPSTLPRGFQSGNAVLVVYVADQIDTDAKRLCENNVRLGFAQFYISAAFDLSRGTTVLLKSTPLWGRVYYGKFRYILSRLLSPQGKPNREPLSTWGMTLIVLVLLPLLLNLIIILRFLVSRL